MYEGEQSAPSSGGTTETTPRGETGDWLLSLELVAHAAQTGLTISAA